jgi:hypothetical protein
MAAQRIARASPSHIVARSMLTFDLHGGKIDSEEIPGESELFVKFVKDRRTSNGRGSLKELINKRIALQVGAQALANREADKNAKAQKATDKEPEAPQEVKPKPVKPKSHKKKKPEKVSKPVITSRRDSEFLEVPLGQDDLDDPLVSQTQVLERSQEVMSQTQVYRPESPTPVEETRLLFLATPQVDIGLWSETLQRTEGEHLEPVMEEEENEGEEPSQRKPVRRNRFIDDEAEESGDGSEEFSDDGSGTDLSDLIASSPEQSQSQGDHARLHAEWLHQREEAYDPFAVKNRHQEEVGELKAKRRLRRALFPINELPIPAKPKKPTKKIEKQVKPVETIPSVPRAREPIRVKKYPHRKSSVSSACSELDVRVGGQPLNNRPSSGTFSFIQAPAMEKLEKASASITVREEATAKAMTGATRLMGNKRFVFGQNTVD